MTDAEKISAFLDTEPAQRILRFMCFELGKEAHLWVRAGNEIPKKAEAEQAFMMTKMLKHAATHGDRWIDAYNAERRQLLDPYQAIGAAIRFLGPSDEELAPFVDRAAVKWCAAKERPHDNDDVIYFRANWSALAGLRSFVLTEHDLQKAPSE